jgi:capsule polysaccharide export protein KpsE/RkpR
MKQSSESVLPELPNTAVWNTEQGAGAPIDLLALLRSFVARWPLLLLAMVGGAVLGYGLSYLMTPVYQSSAVFLPPQQRAPMSDNPLAALFSTPNSGVLYPGLLKSDSVVDSVLHALDLQQVYGSRDLDEARATLRKNTTISSDTAGFYTLAVRDRSRERAKAIADKYMQALAAINSRLAVDEAKQQRSVYEHELLDAKNQLGEAEEALAAMQRSSGVVSAQSQTQAGLAAINQLRAQITGLQVQLAALRQAQTDASPAVVRMRAEIDQLQTELGSMERGSGGGAGAGLTAAQAPQANLEFMRLQREVLYQQSLYEILVKQFESTQLEAIATPGVQIVDFPELSLKKAAPVRRIWAVAGGLLAEVAAVFLIFVQDRYRVMRADPLRAREMSSLAEAIRKPTLRP